MEYKEFFSELDEHIKVFEQGTINTAGNVEFQNRYLINQIGSYIQSKYLGGMKDKRTGKRLRFRNIGNAIVDLEFRAKNIDRKAVEGTATDGDHTFSMVVNKLLAQWMKDNNFGATIDEYQRKKSEYGTALLKKTITRENGKRKLHIDVSPWSFTQFNAKDILGGIIVEENEMSPLEIRKRTEWDTEAVERAIQLHKKNRKDGEDMKVLDVEGEFPVEYFQDEETEDKTFTTARFNVIVAVVGDKKICLYKDKLTESRFKRDRRKTVEGRDFGVGVWEELLEPQIAINEAVIAEADTMDIAGKVIIKTNKKSNIPNALAMVNGEMVELEQDEFMDSMSLAPSALPQWGNIVNEWFLNAQRDQSAFAGMTGEEPKASTPFSSLALQASQGGSIFNKRRDQDGFFLSEVVMDWILPFVVEENRNTTELSASFSPIELKMIDDAYKTEQGNLGKIDAFLNNPDALLSPIQQDQLSPVDKQLERARDQRKITGIPKGYLTMDKIRKKMRFDITGEMSDSQRELNALATRLQSLAPEDPARKMIIDQMAEIAGISPASFGGVSSNGKVDAKTVAAQPSKVEQIVPEGQR